jgi:hypothetical protein
VTSVAELQRAMSRVCFDREPSPHDVALLGSERAILYRDLVRSRLRGLIPMVLPRTEKVLGAGRVDALFARFLAEAAPSSRYFREVIPSFLAFALPELAASGAPEHARDVAVLESTQWEVGWREAADVGALAPFDLERVPVAHPTLRLLTLGHALEGGVIAEPARKVATYAAIHRRADQRVETRVLDATGARLLAQWSRGDRTAIEGVQAVLVEERRAADEKFVERMSALLAGLLDSGALLGSRPA